MASSQHEAHGLTISDSNNPNKRKPRNARPCGNCSGSQVRCDITAPNSMSLCKFCKELGLTACPPYAQRETGIRRMGRHASYKKKATDNIPPQQSNDASNEAGIQFVMENDGAPKSEALMSPSSSDTANGAQGSAALLDDTAQVVPGQPGNGQSALHSSQDGVREASSEYTIDWFGFVGGMLVGCYQQTLSSL